VLEYLVKSDVLNCQHSLSDMMSTSLAQKAVLWDFYGHRYCTSVGAREFTVAAVLSVRFVEQVGIICVYFL